jgi:archaemetzincin
VRRTIHILNSSSLGARAINHLGRVVEQALDCPVELKDSPLEIAAAYDQSRRQYSSTILLATMLADGVDEPGKYIAVVDVDLYVPVLTFVFGEAQFNGSAAVVSLHRLVNQFYGLPRNDDLMLNRLEKETVHELGHTLGLYHCRQFECVMRSSTYVEEIDLKRSELCTSCHALLRQMDPTFSLHHTKPEKLP